MVYVCGLPGSGNRAVAKMIEAAGGETMIVHGVPDLWYKKGNHYRRAAERIYRHGTTMEDATSILIPVRSRKHREKTYRGRADDFYDWCHPHSDVGMLQRIFHQADALQLPVRLMSYEAFVADPHTEGNAVLAELRLRKLSPEWYHLNIKDGNALQEEV